MRKPLTRVDLDRAITAPGDCAHPNGLGLHASCHEQAGLEVWYAEGVLLLRCGQCGRPLTTIAVADPPMVVS